VFERKHPFPLPLWGRMLAVPLIEDNPPIRFSLRLWLAQNYGGYDGILHSSIHGQQKRERIDRGRCRFLAKPGNSDFTV
jgi:hypothetical protein